MDGWSLVYYVATSGNIPVKEYINSQSPREKACVFDALSLLRENGISLKLPYAKPIKGRLWELRALGEFEHRIFYFAYTGRQFVLLHAFTKKTQKAPTKETALATKRMKEYLKGR